MSIGEDVTIGRYLTPEAIRLGLSGLVAGSAVGLAWCAARRVRWGAAPFVLAVMAAMYYVDRSDSPKWNAMAAVGVLVMLLAGIGAARLLSEPGASNWVAAGALISSFGVYAGVPETGPPLLVGGVLSGLVVMAAATRAHWAPLSGVGIAVVLGWAALSGAAGRPWATVGGALCSGVAPWIAVCGLFPEPSWSRRAGPWLLIPHTVLVMAAARWIGVVPHAGWHRVGILAIVGLAVAAATHCRA